MHASQEELLPLCEDERPREGCLRQVLMLALGQFLAMLITSTGVFSQLLATRGVNLPTTQSFVNYALLSVFILPLLQRGGGLKVPWWQYAAVAVFDVEGNYLLVKAYQYTTITSVQLLDCGTIFMVMAISRVLFKRVYSWLQLLSTAVCLLGLVLLVLSDFLSDRYTGQLASSPLIGDALVLAGCVCYAISNVFQEHVVKTFDVLEFLAMIGVFGALVSGCQILLLERQELVGLDRADTWIWVYMAGFGASLFTLYALTPVLIRRTSALFLNLSLLTADFWSLLFATYIFGASLSILYFVAFVCIVFGLVVFNAASWERKLQTSSSQTGPTKI